MVLHVVLLKLNMTAVLRGTVVSPAALLISFIVKVSFGHNWMWRELDNASHNIRVFLFRMSRIMFGHTTENRGNDDPGSNGRLERAIMLIRRTMAARPSIPDEASIHLLSMTAL